MPAEPKLKSTSKLVVALPEEIQSHQEFKRCVDQIRINLTGVAEYEEKARIFLDRMYYLLAWMVGDASKNFTSKLPLKARIQLNLCRQHVENLELGQFVANCVAMLGIPCKRLADELPRAREPHGLYRWQSYYSEVIAWLQTACLGLEQYQRTSYDRVKMNWILSAPREHRIWFLRGLADSDGTVNVRNRTVVITTAPNTELVSTLFKSLNINSLAYFSNGVGNVAISAGDAWKLPIFNPDVETHRTHILRKLANARTYQRRWPTWLEVKVARLLRQGLNASAIRNKILFEDETYIKLKTIRQKQYMN